MPLKSNADIRKQIRDLRKLKRDIPRMAGSEAVRHFKESFKAQGFTDQRLKAWPPRKRSDPDESRRGRRAILIKTGALRRSVRVVRRASTYVIVGTDLPYARIHNEGGTITGSQSVPRHRRRAHTRRQRGRRVRVQAHEVQAHSRNVNTTIPQRRFIGISRKLNEKIEKRVIRKLNQILN